MSRKTSTSSSRQYESKRMDTNGICSGCDKKLLLKEVEIPGAKAPYNKKSVCSNCGEFKKWTGESCIDADMSTRISTFFEVNEFGMNEKFYQSLFYQWVKTKTLTPRQLESLLKHPKFL